MDIKPIKTDADYGATLKEIVKCQHFSGHIITQLFAVFRSLPATNSHWQNEGVLDYKRPRYIQKSPA